MTLHEMALSEVDYTKGYVYINSAPEGIPQVYAIRLSVDPTVYEGEVCLYPDAFGEIGGEGGPSYNTKGCIQVSKIAEWAGHFTVNYAGLLSTVISHEIGHGIGLNHCPDDYSPNCYMWGPADKASPHVTQYAGHHDQDYDLVVGGPSAQSPLGGNSDYPDRTYIPDIGVRVRQPVDVNGDGDVNILDLTLMMSYFGQELYRSPMDIDGNGTVNIIDLMQFFNAFNNPTCSYTQLFEDVNSDGVVNIFDLTLVASNMGESGTHVADYDVNGDCEVDIADLTLVAQAFGNTVSDPEE